MQDATVKSYARAFAVITRALKENGSRIDLPSLIDKASADPVDGFTPVFVKAVHENVLVTKINRLVQTILDEVDSTDDLHPARPLPQYQQGLWLLEYEHWKDYMTPSEAAEKLGVTKQRISALIQNDQLEAIKVGKNWYISSFSVDTRIPEKDYVVKQTSIRYENISEPDLRRFATEDEAREFYDSIDLGKDWRNELQTSGNLEGMKHTTITKELYHDDDSDTFDTLEYEEYSYEDYQAWYEEH